MPGVVSVFPNRKRTLHTTHSWDFMGLSSHERMEIPGFSTKSQVNVIIGFIDTGNLSVPFLELLFPRIITCRSTIWLCVQPMQPLHLLGLTHAHTRKEECSSLTVTFRPRQHILNHDYTCCGSRSETRERYFL